MDDQIVMNSDATEDEIANVLYSLPHDGTGLRVLASEYIAHVKDSVRVVEECESLQSQLAAERERADRLQRVVDEMVRTLNGVVGASPKHWEMSMDQFCEEFVPWARSRARMLLDMAAAPVPAQRDRIAPRRSSGE